MATLAAVDFEAKGWNPQVTTFGQPKVGNGEFVGYLTEVCFPSWFMVFAKLLLLLSSNSGIRNSRHRLIVE